MDETTRMTAVARALNAVESAGEARAAIGAAFAWTLHGAVLAGELSAFSTPDPAEARTMLAILQAELSAEERIYDNANPTDPVDPATWARQRRAIERAYIEVAGIQGAVAGGASVNLADELVRAVGEAPGVILRAVEDAAAATGEAAGAVLTAAGSAAGAGVSGLLGGLGIWAVVLVVVGYFLLRGRA